MIELTWGHANQGGHHDWPFLMALQQGFFADEGIDLSIRVVPGGDELAAAMGRGEISLGRMGTPPFLQAIDKEVFDGVIVASSVIGNLDHFFLVVSPDIHDLKELRGKTVGVLSKGSCDGHLMKLELARAGLDPERDVEYRELFSEYESVDGLASGELSAQLMVEPLVSLGEGLGVLRMVEPVSVARPRFQWGLLVARRDFCEQQPDLLKRCLVAYLRGAQYCTAHPEETRALVAPTLPQLTTRMLDTALQRTLPVWNTHGQVDRAGLEIAAETMLEIGSIRRVPDTGHLLHLEGLPTML